MEEMTLTADRTLANLLNSIAQKMPGGLDDVLIVLTSDHGVSPNPDLLKTLLVDSGRIVTSNVIKAMEEALTTKFGAADGKWIIGSSELNFYSNQSAIKSKWHIPLEQELFLYSLVPRL